MSKHFLVAMLCVCAVAAAGCRRRKESGERVQIRTEDGQVVFDSGASVELPRDFPRDIPLPRRAPVRMAMEMPDGFMVTVERAEAMRDAAADFRAAMGREGWTEEHSMDLGVSVMILFNKGDRAVQSVFVSEEGKTLMTLTSGG